MIRILIEVEKVTGPRSDKPVDIPDVDEMVCSYHVNYLKEKGLVKANNWAGDQAPGKLWRAWDLTAQGHELLRTMRASQEPELEAFRGARDRIGF